MRNKIEFHIVRHRFGYKERKTSEYAWDGVTITRYPVLGAQDIALMSS